MALGCLIDWSHQSLRKSQPMFYLGWPLITLQNGLIRTYVDANQGSILLYAGMNLGWKEQTGLIRAYTHTKQGSILDGHWLI